MKLIVTGASGFIGSHVVECAVARGHEVFAIVRSLPAIAVNGVTYCALDLLRERDATREWLSEIRATHLLHLAWYAVPGQYWTSSENFRWVEASLDLAQSFSAAGGRRLVGAGTCAEYDWSGEGTHHELSAPLIPATSYGIAKNELRQRLEAWAPRVNLTLGWSRLFFIYGPREPPSRLVASVARTLMTGGTAEVTEGTQRRDFLHVRDVADALVAMTESSVRGPVNVGSGKAVAVRDIVEEIGRQTGAINRIAYGAISSRNEPRLIEADVHRLREEVEWQPRFDLTEGIADTIQWWRERLG